MRFSLENILAIIAALAVLVLTIGMVSSSFYSSYLREQRYQQCMAFNNKVMEDVKDKLQKHESPRLYTMVC